MLRWAVKLPEHPTAQVSGSWSICSVSFVTPVSLRDCAHVLIDCPHPAVTVTTHSRAGDCTWGECRFPLSWRSEWRAGLQIKTRGHRVRAGAMIIPWKRPSQPPVVDSGYTLKWQQKAVSFQNGEQNLPHYHGILSNNMWSLFLHSCSRANCRKWLHSSFPSWPFIFFVLVNFPREALPFWWGVCVTKARFASCWKLWPRSLLKLHSNSIFLEVIMNFGSS